MVHGAESTARSGRPDRGLNPPALRGVRVRVPPRALLYGSRLSQVIFGVADLDAATARFRAMGFEVVDGGVHPGVGTSNRVIPLGEEYLELLGVVDHELARASEYGRSLLAAIADGDRSGRDVLLHARREDSPLGEGGRRGGAGDQSAGEPGGGRELVASCAGAAAACA